MKRQISAKLFNVHTLNVILCIVRSMDGAFTTQFLPGNTNAALKREIFTIDAKDKRRRNRREKAPFG